MDRQKLINEVLDRYQERPEVLGDMKRIVKLTESCFRDFANKILNR